MSHLDDAFVAAARKSPVKIDHGDHKAVFEQTDATAGHAESTITAELAVYIDGTLVGYVTPYSSDQRGVVPADQFGTAEPVSFHTVEGALEQLVPGAADGLGTPALQK
jgi:hypothetical protein